MFVSEVLVDCV
jgi:hypothetical protein